MIPKVIHYIWLGGEIPQNVQKVIEHNQQFFTDYEVKIWREEDMPTLNDFAQQAYDEKKWAFVSDYLRFYILYHEGGIYLDTDMEVLKPLDRFLEDRVFAGWDRRGAYIYAGIIGAVPKNKYIEKILKTYDGLEKGEYPTSPMVMTASYHEYGNQKEIKVYDASYFYPLLDGEKATEEKLKNAYANHLWFESWRSFVGLRRFLRRLGVISLYHKLLAKGKK